MKILKEGVLKTATKVCNECGCEMEYNNKDLYSRNMSKMNPPIKEYYIVCPYCEKELFVDKL